MLCVYCFLNEIDLITSKFKFIIVLLSTILQVSSNYHFLNLCVDIGSTTAKVVVMDQETILFQCYERHFSPIFIKK